MIEDWVPMKIDLYNEPKILVIADFVFSSDGELAAYVNQNLQDDMTVTRNVTRNACVGALVTIWGCAKRKGTRNGDDLHIKCARADWVDEVCNMPGFGEAMMSVDWARETAEALVFPGFYEELNLDSKETQKAKNAERQRRYRDRIRNENSNAPRNVTVTSQSDAKEKKIYKNNKKDFTQEFTRRFSQFWEVYPNKKNRAQAEKKFVSLKITDDTLAVIKKNISDRLATGDWDDPKYIPHPTTYLNGKRWEDQISSNGPSPVNGQVREVIL